MKKFDWFGLAVMFGAVLIVVVPFNLYKYSQRYIHGGKVAVSGIYFTSTIVLDNYKSIGEGKSIFGKYTIYTRSVTHEIIKVYENK